MTLKIFSCLSRPWLFLKRRYSSLWLTLSPPWHWPRWLYTWQCNGQFYEIWNCWFVKLSKWRFEHKIEEERGRWAVGICMYPCPFSPPPQLYPPTGNAHLEERRHPVAVHWSCYQLCNSSKFHLHSRQSVCHQSPSLPRTDIRSSHPFDGRYKYPARPVQARWYSSSSLLHRCQTTIASFRTRPFCAKPKSVYTWREGWKYIQLETNTNCDLTASIIINIYIYHSTQTRLCEESTFYLGIISSSRTLQGALCALSSTPPTARSLTSAHYNGNFYPCHRASPALSLAWCSASILDFHLLRFFVRHSRNIRILYCRTEDAWARNTMVRLLILILLSFHFFLSTHFSNLSTILLANKRSLGSSHTKLPSLHLAFSSSASSSVSYPSGNYFRALSSLALSSSSSSGSPALWKPQYNFSALPGPWTQIVISTLPACLSMDRV